MGEIIAVVSHKGGVGKTTTVINLGASLAQRGKNVLLIDFDPQRQILTSFQISDYQLPYGIVDSLIDEQISMSQCLLPAKIENLSVAALVPAKFDEIKIGALLIKNEEELKSRLQIFSMQYDFVIIDCPSSLGAFSELALKVADSLIIPVQCEFYALKSLTVLLKYIKEIKEKYNNKLIYRGFLITMVDLRSKLARLVWQRLQTTLSTALFKTHIPRNIRLAEVPFYGRPVFLIDEKSRGAQHYFSLADEILHQSVTIDSSSVKNSAQIAKNY